MEAQLKLFLFTTDSDFAISAEAAGVDSIIIDWEYKNKEDRQQSYSTEINCDLPEDVARISSLVKIPVTVRVNALGSHTDHEVQVAIANGAKIIMLPMATDVSEVQRFIDIVDGRAQTIIQIETQKLVDQCEQLKSLSWNYVYIGLNDLMITRNSRYIWEPVLDGTVSNIYQTLSGRNVGFGGVTVVGQGSPVPFLDLMGEMARLGCNLSFLRRSFKRDIEGRNMIAEIQAVRYAWKAACSRSQSAHERDHHKFMKKLLLHKT